LKALKAKMASRLRVGQSATVRVRPGPAKATGLAVAFTSSKPSVLAVDKAGRVTAKKPGQATIRVKAGGKTVSLKVKVSRA
jgi:uncharacterized protein YjdB